jgi:predicted nucleic acid-binding protein
VTVVVDASVVVAALANKGAMGAWSSRVLSGEPLAAPHLMPVEVTSALRQLVLRGEVSADLATLALVDVDRLAVTLFAFAPFAARAWELRHNVTPYDAWYVALAESLNAPLATVDDRLRGAGGLRCEVLSPSGR